MPHCRHPSAVSKVADLAWGHERFLAFGLVAWGDELEMFARRRNPVHLDVDCKAGRPEESWLACFPSRVALPGWRAKAQAPGEIAA